MKTLYVKDLCSRPLGSSVELYGWLAGRRNLGGVLFLDLADSTGTAQVIIENTNALTFDLGTDIPLESAIAVVGILVEGAKTTTEIQAHSIRLIGKATLQLNPFPRSRFDFLASKHVNQTLTYRHIYLRNPRLMAVLKFRAGVTRIMRDWFHRHDFIEFDAPIITPATLYDKETALPIRVHDQDLFLTQCAGFYLEAAVHAFERVYNIGPSFRGAESRSKRHLTEYWHVKAELAFGDLEDIIRLVEGLISHVTRAATEQFSGTLELENISISQAGHLPPFPRLSYSDASDILSANGFPFKFGDPLSAEHESFLSKPYRTPFWVVGTPRSTEPFPYSIDLADPRVTRVADLIANDGYGELLGVAEKISDSSELILRLEEKHKLDDIRYDFVKDVHNAGCVPHVAFGMGLERFIRWLIGLEHVRDALAFPRLVRRRITA